jgi:ABC-type nickel/cobalt efflux system permease component RcnA
MPGKAVAKYGFEYIGALPQEPAPARTSTMDAHHELRLGMSLVAAFLLGALHVLEPAHGRSIITAVAVGLTGSRASVLRYALTVTVAHAAATFLIAVAVALLGSALEPGSTADAVRALGSLLTIYLGGRMLKHASEEGADCHCPMHAEKGNEALGLGVAGGLIPCYGSLALVMAAAGTGHFGAAVPLVLAFALGLGVTLLVAALMSEALAKVLRERMDRLFRYAGHVSGAAILLAGLGNLAYVIAQMLFGGPAH